MTPAPDLLAGLDPRPRLVVRAPSPTLSADERAAIVIAAGSVLRKLRNLYTEIQPAFLRYGFTPPSPGVMARDLSEKIEQAICQHCATFQPGRGHVDLLRAGEEWEVKVCAGAGITINQSRQIRGENYIVVNYARASSALRAIWILWQAKEAHFTARRANSNARKLAASAARGSIEILYPVP